MAILFHPHKDDITLPSVLYALGDPIRLSITRRIAEEGDSSCADTFPYPVAKSTLSHHLRILREAGIILARKHGREYHNSLRRDELDTLFPGLLDAVLKASDGAVDK